MNSIKKVCVIGSGVMGSGIAAHIASKNIKVVLLDIPSNEEDRNSIVRLNTQKIFSSNKDISPELIQIGNLNDDLELLRTCDLIIEVIVEKLEIKWDLYKKITPYIKESAILASNTSTLLLKDLTKHLDANLSNRFCITHFFNPPQIMKLLELITTPNNDPKVFDKLNDFLTNKLEKTVIHCSDTPGFIANRIGCFLLELVVRKTIEKGLQLQIVDNLFARLLKLPRSAIFGTYDIIGHDVMKLISESLIRLLPNTDEYTKIYTPLATLDNMLSSKLIGRKSGAGFYKISKQDGKTIRETINFDDLTYLIPTEIDVLKYQSIEDLLRDDSPYSKLFNEIINDFRAYIHSLIPNVTRNLDDIDTAMKLGYAWELGPFDIIQQEKIQPDRMLVFNINTKVNTLNFEVFIRLMHAIDEAEEREQPLYIYSESPYFSAGADLKLIQSLIQAHDFSKLDDFLKLGQQAMMRMKYSSQPVISYAKGAALGGGMELLLHSSFIVAHPNTNAGLVELGVGFVPSFGGIKEMFLRSKNDPAKLTRNLSNILNQYKTQAAQELNNYDIDNFVISSNTYTIPIARHIKHIQDKYRIPQINLQDSIDITKYNKLQLNILTFFQEIIDMKEVDEQTLLDLERQKFIELAKTSA